MARDPIPLTRGAVNRLVVDVGDPGLDALTAHVPADEHGKKDVSRTTVHELLTGPVAGPRKPKWATIAAVVRACESYHRMHGGRAAHQRMAEAGRFDLDQAGPLRVLFDRETGGGPSAQFVAVRDRYLSRLRERYQRVDLEILTPLTDQGEHPVMLLEQVFVAQRVRADPPPVEVPREVWQRLVDVGLGDDAHLPEQVDREKLEAVLRAYRDRPCRPVLEVIAEPAGRKLVLLGDPGAGKSTLARYLLLALAGAHAPVDGTGDPVDSFGGPGPGGRVPVGLRGCLPLLVELRTYAESRWRAGREVTFLDLIDHLHGTEDVGLPRSVLEPFLDDGGAAVVIFDGLDEVFDPRVRAEVTAQIEGFAARYPRVRVVVTSRVIGYRRQMLDGAGFGHWMLQDLDDDQIRAFTTGWYDRSCPDDPVQAGRLRDRLLAAVGASAAVGELAGNPMLLTILAIIGRRQELPRDRRSVYEHAVNVLVERWDVNRHLRDERINVDLLDAQDKLELLQLVARHMQDAPKGLAGNHVPGPNLVDWFRGYLEQRFGLPAERSIPAARAMLAQFRERNFILARFGSEVYGFVHRAFLEYLAAGDLTRRLTDFDLTPDQVLAVYEQHWHDPAWAEVLLLLTGMIPDRLAVQAITRLLAADPYWRLRPYVPRHLLLALQASTEIRKTATLAPHAHALTRALTTLLEETATREQRHDQELSDAVDRLTPHLAGVFSPTWPAAVLYQNWYHRSSQRLASIPPYTTARTAATIHTTLTSDDLGTLRRNATDPNWATREAAVRAIAAGWADDPGTLPWLRDRATTDPGEAVRRTAVEAIAAGWADDPGTLPWLCDRATTDDHWAVRQAAVEAIAAGWADDPGTLPWLRDRATTDDHWAVRQAAVEAIAAGWADDPGTLPWLRDRATTDPGEAVRQAAVEAIAAGWAQDEGTLPWLRDRATTDPGEAVRQAAVEAIAAGWADDPGTLPWLCDRATTDDHWAVRRAAVEAIAAGWAQDEGTLPWLRDRATTGPGEAVRQAAVRAIAAGWAQDEGTLPWLRDRATTDPGEAVRWAAVRAIAAGWADDPGTLPWQGARATTDDHRAVRQAAVRAIAAGWADVPGTLPWLRDRATTDPGEAVRQAAVQAIAAGWAQDEGTLPWLRDRATTDPDEAVRQAAVQAIAAGWAQDEGTLPWLRDRATTDPDEAVRQAAVRAIAAGWADDPGTLPWLCDRATTDPDEAVRQAAVRAIAAGWADDPGTLPWLCDRATTDPDEAVRQAAVQAIAAGWADDPGTLPWLRDRATTDDHWAVRRAAVQAIAAGWADDPGTLPWLRDRATTDDHWAVRQAAVQAIAAGWAQDEGTLPWLRDRAITDDHGAVRWAAVQAIAAGWADDPGTLPWLRDRATTDDHRAVRQAAVEAIAAGWADDPGTLPWLCDRATTDPDEAVRQAAVQAIAAGWAQDEGTLPLLRDRATTDPDEGLRQAAYRRSRK
ncbi:HEAT repeat domain-containing protein [Dactylosporangium sp. NBC_01737]|uniref:HEAT repeat domain-containing protein n=1 Tax=Dactylosporangium sp. NBC_01737 TaxID=2975959 RepID=UPI002E133DB4|nr:HEAT repeat domain-containing protein [Dactylosporangium sp. NBC_01737]